MRISLAKKNAVTPEVVDVLCRVIARVPWPERRQAMAETTERLLAGSARVAEDVFGWSRKTVELGLNERRTGIVCRNVPLTRKKPKTEEKYPQMVLDIEKIMAPQCQADPQLRTSWAYTKLTAAAVRKALVGVGWAEEQVPCVRTMSNLLGRLDYRLRTVAKTRVQKKQRRPMRSSRMCTPPTSRPT